jgi:hypothetical protein
MEEFETASELCSAYSLRLKVDLSVINEPD